MLLLQVAADAPEVGQLHPAGLDAAAPRHAVALTGSPHGGFDGLQQYYKNQYLPFSYFECQRMHDNECVFLFFYFFVTIPIVQLRCYAG